MPRPRVAALALLVIASAGFTSPRTSAAAAAPAECYMSESLCMAGNYSTCWPAMPVCTDTTFTCPDTWTLMYCW